MATPGTAQTVPPTPKRATGSHFYKYGSLAEPDQLGRLKNILLKHELYVPTVEQFKDPTDCRPRLAPLSEDKMFSTFYDFCEKGQLEATIRAHDREKLMRGIARVRDEQFKEFRIYCLSKRYDILPMWENYADNHRGYCLEFANEGPFFGAAKEVIYGDTIEIDLSNPEHQKSWVLFCKREDYKFEHEVRVHCRRTFPQFARIDPNHLTRIILGQEMSEEHQKQILELARQRNPQLTVVAASWDQYKQEFKLIPKNHL